MASWQVQVSQGCEQPQENVTQALPLLSSSLPQLSSLWQPFKGFNIYLEPAQAGQEPAQRPRLGTGRNKQLAAGAHLPRSCPGLRHSASSCALDILSLPQGHDAAGPRWSPAPVQGLQEGLWLKGGGSGLARRRPSCREAPIMLRKRKEPHPDSRTLLQQTHWSHWRLFLPLMAGSQVFKKQG